MFTASTLLSLAGCVSAGKVLWDGHLNTSKTSAFLDKWSFSNEVGPYQYCELKVIPPPPVDSAIDTKGATDVHGDGPVSEYVNLGTAYKNPADKGSTQGIQISINNSSVWNNDGMLRTELIPQTTAPINKGKVFYHFSMQHTGVDPPSPYEEHQVCFFESHFAEMKYGLID